MREKLGNMKVSFTNIQKVSQQNRKKQSEENGRETIFKEIKARNIQEIHEFLD